MIKVSKIALITMYAYNVPQPSDSEFTECQEECTWYEYWITDYTDTTSQFLGLCRLTDVNHSSADFEDSFVPKNSNKNQG